MKSELESINSVVHVVVVVVGVGGVVRGVFVLTVSVQQSKKTTSH